MRLAAKLAALLMIAIALAAGVWKIRHDGYKAGAESVRQEYAAKATQAALEAMKTQERLQESVAKIGERHEQVKRQNAIISAAADDELGRLRSELAARDRQSSESPPTSCRIDAGRAERDILGQCALALTTVAKEADRIEAKLNSLQEYVKDALE